MKPNLVGRVASVILGLMAAALTSLAQVPESDIHLTVLLYDYVNLPPSVRSELTADTVRILGHAGITVEFVECLAGGVKSDSGACLALLGPTDFVLRIFPPTSAKTGEELGNAILGPGGGVLITVYPRPARAVGLSTGRMLGHGVAHEIGHLLLGVNAHAASGIMRPVMRQSDQEKMVKRWLLFDANQAKRMRTALIARASQ
jgi:hypothetical protein